MLDNNLDIVSLSRMLRPRQPEGNKSTFGHALLIAGSWGMAGASVLAGRACLRSGVGKLTLHIPCGTNDIVQISVPEAIVRHDVADSPCFSVPVPLEPYCAVAVGPGLGLQSSTCQAFARQLQLCRQKCAVPLLLDADALNILALHPELVALLPEGSILTPHLGELARLLHLPLEHLLCDEENCCRMAAEMAVRQRVTVVMKGAGTRIFSSDGRRARCPWGNDGMATAGSGDVLTGVILGLLAQGHPSFEAASLGVSLHALAGDAAASRLGRHSLIASDLVEHLPEAFLRLRG